MGQMFYVDQLSLSSFSIGLLKTEFGFIVRSVETGLGRLTLVVAVFISVDAYPFLVFSDLTRHHEVFSGCTVPTDSKKTDLGSSDQKTGVKIRE